MSIDLSHIPEDELHEYREIFGLVDEDGSGEIGKEEVAQLMQMLVRRLNRAVLNTLRPRLQGLNVSDAELDKMVEEIDADGSGEIGPPPLDQELRCSQQLRC